MPDDMTSRAAAIVANVMPEKARIQVSSSDATATARAVQRCIAEAGRVFERGPPVKLKRDQLTGTMRALPLTLEAVIFEAHRQCQPFIVTPKGKDKELVERDVTLPVAIARLILDGGEWELRPLHGITSAPILDEAGGIRSHDGYDEPSGLWCEGVPDVRRLVPAKPTDEQAKAALLTLRQTFRTFPFADAGRVHDAALKVDVVDLTKPPGADESAMLAGVLTAVCRPSLHLAPGWLIRAPSMSGAGSGKGLLARAMNLIAFGRQPQAFTGGHEAAELDKRLVAELIEAAPAVFLDNFNHTALRSDILASVLTERPCRVRVMRESRMVPLNCAAFIAVTGNGLTVSEDLVRRFIAVELDAGMEDPEARPFQGDFLADVLGRRQDLLAAVLTVWRWGRQNTTTLKPGAALGSYGQWCRWVRDPLLTLGCADPVVRIASAKASDARRQQIAEMFAAWYEHHHDLPVRAAELHDDVRAILDPQTKGRQYVRANVEKLVGTRLAGMVLTVSKPAGKHGAATYAVQIVAKAPAQHEVVL